MGLRSKLNHLPPRNEVVHAYANHDKAKEIFKIDSTVSLRDGLFKMADWAKNAGSRKSKLETRNERLKTVVFQAQLGTVYEKAERISELAAFIAAQIGAAAGCGFCH